MSQQLIINFFSHSTNVSLNGSAIIFSSKYVRKFGFLFYPKPGFFVEEDILHFLVLKEKLVSVYNPSIKVIHYEDVSTNLKNDFDANVIWKLNETINSLLIFKRLVDKYD